jgi:hypothetical protein
MHIAWTRHAEDRQRLWEVRIGISRDEVERLVASPGQLVPGDAGAFVAQGKRGEGLLRVVFRESGGERKILTLYWTSRTSRYWKEEKDAG